MHPPFASTGWLSPRDPAPSAATSATRTSQEAMGGPSEEPESAFKEPVVLEPKKGKGKAWKVLDLPREWMGI